MGNVSEQLARDVILNSIADGVFTVDRDWMITSFNRAAEQITGISRAEAMGRKCFDVFRANICQSNCALQDTMRTGQQWVDRRINILNSRGEEVPVSISTSILRDVAGQPVGGVESFRDLSGIELLRKDIDNRYTSQDIISKNREMRRILEALPNIALSGCTVLIEGPTGTGKELVAKAIHHLSARAKGKYVVVNCGALPDALLASELFGYKKGAFTDATKDKPGRFALAKGGTLFLDEIGDISMALQVSLLRVLQEKEYEPLGGTATIKADVRMIAATNKPLAEQVARGVFREDLLYRLNVVKIVLPALKDRREDIPLLIHRFMRQFNAEHGKRIDAVSSAALAILMRYSYPGNVRELQNIIQHGVVLCQGNRIDVNDLPLELQEVENQGSTAKGASTVRPLREAEAETIVKTLHEQKGHRGKTAAALGIDKSTLWRKMKAYNIAYP